MPYTIEELKQYLAHKVDEVDILELLNLSSEDIVEAFHDKIDDRYSYLIRELELEDDSAET